MHRLQRRLGALERTFQAQLAGSGVKAVALDTGVGDMTLVGSAWVPCPDAARVLREHRGPLKVYCGFNPLTVCGDLSPREGSQ